MFKATMRDNLGWMKDVVIITGSMVELIKFISTYNPIGCDDIILDNLTKLDDYEEYVILTKDGLKLSIKNK